MQRDWNRGGLLAVGAVRVETPGNDELEIDSPERGLNPTLLALAPTFGWTPAALAAECAERPDAVRVARLCGQPAAILVTRRGPAELHVLGLAVEPRVRRRGVARALVIDLIHRCASDGDEFVHLEVRAGNAPAIALYQGLGFRIVGKRPRYYRDGEDALLMTLELRNAADGVERAGEARSEP